MRMLDIRPSRKVGREHYSMECDCGRRANDEVAEKDCEESAMLEDSNQA